MKEKKPMIEIMGDEFVFDLDKLALVEKNNPDHIIYFSEMENHLTHYILDYKPPSKTHSTLNPYEQLHDLLNQLIEGTEIQDTARTRVTIPRMAQIDPDGMRKKYGCTHAELQRKTDLEIIVPQDLYRSRIEGCLVTVDFPGKTYFVDVVNNMLRPVDDQGSEIKLTDFAYDYYMENDEIYHLFYNIKEQRVEDVLRDQHVEEDCIILELPNLTYLDPIGTNIALGRHPSYGLMDLELKNIHTPKIVPWEVYHPNSAMKEPLHYHNVPSGTDLFELRTKKGFLPRIYIYGHTFFVDVQKGCLRPRDEFSSTGIQFNEIKDYYNDATRRYTIPYDPAKKEFVDFKLEDGKEPPANLMVISFPDEQLLDPVGWKKQTGGVNKLTNNEIILHRQARAGTWDEIRHLQNIRQQCDRDTVQSRHRRHRM